MKHIIRGSFIQNWYCGDFNDERWAREFEAMKKCGMEFLIIEDAEPSRVKKIIAQASKNKCKVVLSTGEFSRWWKGAGITEEIIIYYTERVKLIKSLWASLDEEERGCVFAWYFTPEIAPIKYLTYNKCLVKAMNILIDGINTCSPGIPLMLSPYYTMFLSKSIASMEEDWVKLISEVSFREYDILCPQDAIGAGWSCFEILDATMEMYLNAIKRSGKKLQYWVNCENFTQNHKGLPFMHKKTENQRCIPAPVGRFARQIENAEKYTDNIITFSYNHYYSPLLVNPDYSRLLNIYLETGEIPECTATFPDVSVVNEDGNIKVKLSGEIKSDIAIQALRFTAIRNKGEKLLFREDLPMKPDAKLPLEYNLGKLRILALRLTAIDAAGHESSIVLR